MSATVCTDLSDKEPHRRVGVDQVIALGNLGNEMDGPGMGRRGFES